MLAGRRTGRALKLGRMARTSAPGPGQWHLASGRFCVPVPPNWVLCPCPRCSRRARVGAVVPESNQLLGRNGQGRRAGPALTPSPVPGRPGQRGSGCLGQGAPSGCRGLQLGRGHRRGRESAGPVFCVPVPCRQRQTCSLARVCPTRSAKRGGARPGVHSGQQAAGSQRAARPRCAQSLLPAPALEPRASETLVGTPPACWLLRGRVGSCQAFHPGDQNGRPPPPPPSSSQPGTHSAH